MKQSAAAGILKGATIISLFMLLGRGLGFIQKLIVAHYYGTGMEADAYTLAFSSIVFTFCAIPEKVLAPFLPLFAERRDREGEAQAWSFASSVGTILMFVMAGVVLAGIAAAPYLVRVASSFKSPEAFQLATLLVRAMLPMAFFMSLFYLTALVLNAYKRFARPALGETLNRVVIILTIILLYRTMGISGLAVGVVLGAAAALSLQILGLRQYRSHVRLHVDWQDPHLRQLAFLIPPVVAAIFIAVLRTVLDYRFASGMGQGYASSLSYAKGLTDAMVLIVPNAVGVVIYPFFSDMSAERDKVKLMDTLIGAIRVLALVFVPISVILMVLRVPVVQLAFQRGRFEEASVALTAGPVLYYALGLTSFAAEIILMRLYFSMKDTLTPTLVGIAGVVVHVGVVLSLRSAMHHRAMALAATISKTAKVAALYFLLKPKLGDLRLRANAIFVLKTLAAAGAMALVVYGTYAVSRMVLPVPASGGKLLRMAYLATQLGASSAAGIVVFALATLALKIDEARLIGAKLRNRFRHGRTDPSTARP